ncbi:C4-dicarboxylate transporter, DctQ subunit [Desulfonauticus submarinus]|uniref:C4-dicarboxylate transporter, DctQ subunit n=1 Tax=Desulfonauticus submarinus TaxID=206665 RepID=A0A1H0CIW3_9BACT|nr:TRAP transporter small permease [Desulfonauticus submarinus]SDN57783.1 C4-dicarboxylate transporter, DctQ subunit [Desulfonauticus submarinus]
MLAKLDKAISYFSLVIMTICMSVATIVAFINVVLRYLLNTSLPWAGALTAYLFIWSALFGAAYGFRTGMHIGVTIIIQSLKPKIGKILLIINLIIILLFLICFTKWGIDFIIFSINLHQIDIDLRIPFWIIYLCVPLSLLISTYQVFLKLLKTIRTPADKFSYDQIMQDQNQ